jgi:hypothetical protein
MVLSYYCFHIYIYTLPGKVACIACLIGTICKKSYYADQTDPFSRPLKDHDGNKLEDAQLPILYAISPPPPVA